jgi:selenocysteine lyase/cysteine desulfurase
MALHHLSQSEGRSSRRQSRAAIDRFVSDISDQFFDWASTSPLSLPARGARDQFNARLDTAIDPSEHLRAEVDRLFALREILARLFGAPTSHAVLFARSISEALMLIAHTMPQVDGRFRIVTTELDHPAAAMAWIAPRSPSWEVLVAPSTSAGLVDVDAIRQIADHRTAAICVTHVSNVHGTVQPITEIVAAARAVGAVSIVDGAQAAGRIPVDVADLGCDAYIGVGRKAMLGPLGAGFVIADKTLLQNLRPVVLSTRAATLVTPLAASLLVNPELAPLPERLEGKLPDLAALNSLWGTAEALVDIGIECIFDHVSSLVPSLVKGLGRLGFSVACDSALEDNAGIVTFTTPRHVDGLVMRKNLLAHGTTVAATRRSIRVSLHVANSQTSVDQLLHHIERCL